MSDTQAKPDLKVVEINPRAYRDPVTALRGLADDIESGMFPNVRTVGVVMLSEGSTEVFGMGPVSDAATLAVAHSVAARHLSEVVIGVYVDERA